MKPILKLLAALPMVWGCAAAAQSPSPAFNQQVDAFCNGVVAEVLQGLTPAMKATCSPGDFLARCKAERNRIWSECSKAETGPCLAEKRGPLVQKLMPKMRCDATTIN